VAYDPNALGSADRAGVADAASVDAESGPCALISEYIEGVGTHNKAVEVFNCGVAPIALHELALCIVPNDAAECGPAVSLGEGWLEPGSVITLCHGRAGPPGDPIDAIRDHCDIEASQVVFFNGDDRLVLFRDADRSGSYAGCSDAIIDILGTPGERPIDMPWADVTLRRCKLVPTAGGPRYDYRRYFADYPLHDGRDFGRAPTPDCL